jgi:hypothetical protein
VKLLHRFVRDPISVTPMAQRVIDVLKTVRATELEHTDRCHFMSFMLWFGAHQAMSKKLWNVSSAMLRYAFLQAGDIKSLLWCSIMSSGTSIVASFPLSVEDIVYHVRVLCSC